MTMRIPEVVIAGGGFAGLSAANALRPLLPSHACKLTLVDANSVTAMIPALPDYVTGVIPQNPLISSIQELLPGQGSFIQARIGSIDCARKEVKTDQGVLVYDYLVLALGSVATPTPAEWDSSNVYTLATFTDAQRLHNAFMEKIESHDSSPILISGAGYTGVELAISMARRLRGGGGGTIPIMLIDRNPEIMPFLSARQKQRVLQSLARHHITLKMASRIARVEAGGIVLSDGTSLASSLICRTEGTCAPLRPSGIAAESLSDGRLCVDKTLALCDGVYAAGDSAAIEQAGRCLRKAVNFAFYSGRLAGNNIARQIQKKHPRPFRPIDLGWVIPLGDDSVGQAFGSVPLAGKPGLMLHYFMCGYRNHGLRNFSAFAKVAIQAGIGATIK